MNPSILKTLERGITEVIGGGLIAIIIFWAICQIFLEGCICIKCTFNHPPQETRQSLKSASEGQINIGLKISQNSLEKEKQECLSRGGSWIDGECIEPSTLRDVPTEGI